MNPSPYGQNTNCRLNCDRSITADRNVHSNRPHTVISDKTISVAYLADVAMPNIHTLHSTVTERLQKYADL